MSEPERPRGRVPWGLAGMLVLVAAVEASLAGRLGRWEPALAMIWRTAGEAAAREAPGRDVLCFGDSQLYYALDPRVLEDRSGLRTYSFAVPGAQASTSYALFRRALAAGARPRAVLVNFNDNQLASLTRDYARLWPEVLDTPELFTVAALAADPRLALEPLGARLLPSLRARDGLRTAILAAARRAPDDTPEMLERIRRAIQDHRGTRPLAHQDRPPTVAGRVHGHGSGRWSCHPANAVFVRRFLALAAAHEIPVFWVLPPVTRPAQARQARSGREAAVMRFVRAQQAAFPGLTVLDARALEIDPALFHDPTHLDAQGGLVLTRALGDALVRYTRTPGPRPEQERWAVLPAAVPDLAAGARGSTRQ